MPLDFPSGPQTNDKYSSGGRTWTWNGTTWTLDSYVGVVPAGSVDTDQLASNAVVLGSKTSGDYVANLVAGTGVTLTNNSGESATPTIAIGQSVATNSSVTFANTTVTSFFIPTTILESASVSATAATGTIAIDAQTNPVVYYTSNSTADWTLNFRGNASVSMNTMLTTNQVTTVTFLATNGSTAYRPTVFQVDGNAVSPKWQGGSAPTSGNANSIDGYVFTILKTGNAAFTVFASQTRFA
jgi:hypothetical protein